MKFFGLKSCDTCRKAQKALTEAGYDLTVQDVRTDGLGAATIARFLEAFSDDLVNRRSTTWRGLSEADRARDPATLLAENPTLMKRPVIETDDGTLHLGWGKDVQSALLGAE